MTRPDRGWGYVPPVSPVLPSVYKQYVWQNWLIGYDVYVRLISVHRVNLKNENINFMVEKHVAYR